MNSSEQENLTNPVISEDLGNRLKRAIQQGQNSLSGKKIINQQGLVKDSERVNGNKEEIAGKQVKYDGGVKRGKSTEELIDDLVENIPIKEGVKSEKIDIGEKNFDIILKELFNEYKEQHRTNNLNEQQYNYCRDLLNDLDETFGKENSKFKELEGEIYDELIQEQKTSGEKGKNLDLFKQLIKEWIEKKIKEKTSKKREEKDDKDYSKENFELLFEELSKELSEKYKHRYQYRDTDIDKHKRINEEFRVQRELLVILFQNLGTNNPSFKKYEDQITNEINKNRGLESVKQVVKNIIEELSKIRESAKNTRKAGDIIESLRIQYENNLKNLREEISIEEKTKKTEKEEEIIKNKLVELNIKLEDLEQIDGFKDLTAGQVLLILENLKQVVFSNIKEKAVKNYGEDMNQLSQGGFWKGLIKTPEKIWKSMTKKYQIAKEEKLETQEIKKNGFKNYNNDLAQIIKGVKENNLDVVEKEGGQFEIQYININDGKLNFQQKKEVEKFNKVATEFSRVPYEWSQKTATKEQQKKFLNAKYNYQKARTTILNIESKIKISKTEAALQMNDIDRKVQYNQFLNAHPEIEKEFKKMTDSNALLAIKSIFDTSAVKHGGFLAFGFGVRCYTMSLIGFFGAPFVAAGIGGFLARKRAKETLKEAEISGRRGEKSKKEETKNFIDADKSTEKINALIKKIETEKDARKKIVLINSLKTRIEYTEDKLYEGLVNSGDKDSRLKNQLELIQVLSKAEIMTSDNIEDERFKLKKKLDKFLNIRKGKIEQAEKKYVNNQTIRGAIMGAGFAVAGYGLRHLAGHWFGWDKNVSVSHGNQTVAGTIPRHSSVSGDLLIESNNQANTGATTPIDSTSAGGTSQDVPVVITDHAPITLAKNIQAPSGEYIDKLSIIQKGEGVWHAVSRQLNDLIKNDPEKFAKQFNLKPEDFDTSAEKEAIINKEIWKLLVDNKIINPDNQTEIRIVNPGTRVVLDLENSKINIFDQNGAPAATYETTLGARETVAREVIVEHEVVTHDKAMSESVVEEAQNTIDMNNLGKTRNILDELEKQANIPYKVENINYSNSHGLGIEAVDENKDGIVDKIFIFDHSNKIIETLSPLKNQTSESFIEQAKLEADRFIRERTLAFEDIVKNSEITMENAKLAGIDFFEGYDLSNNATEKLTFWSIHVDALPNIEMTKDFFNLSTESMVNYHSPKFLHVFENMPANLSSEQEIGYAKIFAGTAEQRPLGILKLFDEKIGIHSTINEKTGVIIIHDAWNNKGVDVVFNEDKIGIRRVGLLNNWGTKGSFGNICPIKDLTPEMINTVKNKIEIFAKNYAENKL